MEKIQRLPRYCETGIGQVVEAIQEWKDPKWDRLVKLFRTVFKRADSVQTYNSQEFLETFKDKMRPDDTDPWTTISGTLVRSGPPTIHSELVFHHSGLDMTRLPEVQIDFVFEKAISISKNGRLLKDIMHSTCLRRNRFGRLM